jgi:GTPase KRas protein
MRDGYMRSGQAFMLLYSITSRTSFDEISMFRDQILRVKDSDSVPMVLIGAKCDLEQERQVQTAEGMQAARQWNIPFFETSAYTKTNVDESFFEAVRQIRLSQQTGGPGAINPKYKKGMRKHKCSIL